MLTPTAVVFVAAVIVITLALLVIFGLPVSGRSFSGPSWRQNFKSMVKTQRVSDTEANGYAGASPGQRHSVLQTMEKEQEVERISEGKLTLRKKLKFANWNHIPPFVFSLSQILVSLLVFLVVRRYFDTLLQIVSLTSGPLFMNWLLMNRVNSRFKRFDNDFPQFLLSLVGLLKTGLNPLQALEAASHGLDPSSSVRQEVQLMLERLRLGVSEDKSIGSFGEDIYHQEIELFVQALILSRRVGGNLSDTLDRLARQVRKRQYFRKSAVAAVGLQRGSIVFILCILLGLELYLYIMWPKSVIDTWIHPTGRTVGQFGICMILLGLYWVGQVTKIRV
jgi:tight adherence protein B